ncbi:MAG: class I SAM-dependent methyltransferase [Chloroflexi bacterium]|nr:class I SAM-dependent methyltransferase [Chloroflexota bacterium]
MANKRVQRALGALLIADGLLKLACGRRYVRLWRTAATIPLYSRVVDWFLRRSGGTLRLIGVAKVALGLAALARAPLEVRELYRAVAPIYDAASFLWREWLYPDAHRALDRALTTYLPPGGHVLDLGCGTGANLERLLAQGLPFGSYVGIDLSEGMLARAGARFARVANVQLQRRNLLTDPLPAGPFDLIVSTWVFSHLPQPERVVANAWEQLRPGGHALLLFLSETGSWLDRLRRPFWEFFHACPLPEAVYRRFPGLVSVERFGGGTATLVVLRKPDGR